MPEQFSHDILASMVLAHVHADPTVLSFTPADGGYFNATYIVEGAARPLIIRIAPADDAGFVFYECGMMAQEPGIHAIVRERTSVPVAEILAYDTGRRFADRDFLLMERLPGVPLPHFHPTQAQRNHVLEQLGGYLREIHEITSDSCGYLGEHNCMEPQTNWADAFRIMWGKMIDDIVAAGYYDPDEEKLARSLLDRHMSHFERPVTFRLLHMDIWDPNILVNDQGDITGILDFDRALWGDKGIEFAVLDYCGISEPAFWRGYGIVGDTSPSAQIRRAFYLLYEVQKYIVIYHHRNREPERAERYKQQSLAMLRQL